MIAEPYVNPANVDRSNFYLKEPGEIFEDTINEALLKGVKTIVLKRGVHKAKHGWRSPLGGKSEEPFSWIGEERANTFIDYGYDPNNPEHRLDGHQGWAWDRAFGVQKPYVWLEEFMVTNCGYGFFTQAPYVHMKNIGVSFSMFDAVKPTPNDLMKVSIDGLYLSYIGTRKPYFGSAAHGLYTGGALVPMEGEYRVENVFANYVQGWFYRSNGIFSREDQHPSDPRHNIIWGRNWNLYNCMGGIDLNIGTHDSDIENVTFVFDLDLSDYESVVPRDEWSTSPPFDEDRLYMRSDPRILHIRQSWDNRISNLSVHTEEYVDRVEILLGFVNGEQLWGKRSNDSNKLINWTLDPRPRYFYTWNNEAGQGIDTTDEFPKDGAGIIENLKYVDDEPKPDPEPIPEPEPPMPEATYQLQPMPAPVAGTAWRLREDLRSAVITDGDWVAWEINGESLKLDVFAGSDMIGRVGQVVGGNFRSWAAEGKNECVTTQPAAALELTLTGTGLPEPLPAPVVEDPDPEPEPEPEMMSVTYEAKRVEDNLFVIRELADGRVIVKGSECSWDAPVPALVYSNNEVIGVTGRENKGGSALEKWAKDGNGEFFILPNTDEVINFENVNVKLKLVGEQLPDKIVDEPDIEDPEPEPDEDTFYKDTLKGFIDISIKLFEEMIQIYQDQINECKLLKAALDDDSDLDEQNN